MILTLKKSDFTKYGWSNFLNSVADQQEAEGWSPSKDDRDADFVDAIEIDTDKPNEIRYTMSEYYTQYLNKRYH